MKVQEILRKFDGKCRNLNILKSSFDRQRKFALKNMRKFINNMLKNKIQGNYRKS